MVKSRRKASSSIAPYELSRKMIPWLDRTGRNASSACSAARRNVETSMISRFTRTWAMRNRRPTRRTRREYLADLFWRRAAGHVEVLGRSAEQ